MQCFMGQTVCRPSRSDRTIGGSVRPPLHLLKRHEMLVLSCTVEWRNEGGLRFKQVIMLKPMAGDRKELRYELALGSKRALEEARGIMEERERSAGLEGKEQGALY